MSPARPEESDLASLRAAASRRLHDAAAAGSATVLGPEAMATLLRMAVTPGQADDALVLQQELQLHQIEIDLLVESLRQAGSRHASALPPAPK